MGMPGPPGRDGRGPKGMPGSPGLGMFVQILFFIALLSLFNRCWYNADFFIIKKKKKILFRWTRRGKTENNTSFWLLFSILFEKCI